MTVITVSVRRASYLSRRRNADSSESYKSNNHYNESDPAKLAEIAPHTIQPDHLLSAID
jgi:hypothetical protein